MTQELYLLLLTTISIAFVHTLTVETDYIKKHSDYKGLKIVVDVDPV